MSHLLLLLIDRMSFLRPAEKRCLLSAVDTPEALGRLTLDDVAQIVRRPLSRRDWYFPMELRAAETAARWIEARGVRVLREEMPSRLSEIYDPPFLLYLRGDGELPERTSIAVVGTRKPDAESARAAYSFGREAAESGVALVSGLARGIDSMVHRGAVAVGGAGVAVLGSGIDAVYPRENRPLAMSLVDRGGAIVSEYGPGVPPLKYHFPARNRIISGLVRAVVLVQAPARSGALITVDHALEQGRDVFVHAGGLGHGRAAGTTGDSGPYAGGIDLSESGAPVVEGFADVAQLVGLEPSRAAGAPPRTTITEVPGASAPWRNSLADKMARQLALGRETDRW